MSTTEDPATIRNDASANDAPARRDADDALTGTQRNDVCDHGESDLPVLNNGHGEITLVPVDTSGKIKQKPVKTKVAGLPAVLNSFRYAISQACRAAVPP
ncbi:MAG: hypothetical protein AAFP69_17490, partial [Planctomycetota bacterium]